MLLTKHRRKNKKKTQTKQNKNEQRTKLRLVTGKISVLSDFFLFHSNIIAVLNVIQLILIFCPSKFIIFLSNLIMNCVATKSFSNKYGRLMDTNYNSSSLFSFYSFVSTFLHFMCVCSTASSSRRNF